MVNPSKGRNANFHICQLKTDRSYEVIYSEEFVQERTQTKSLKNENHSDKTRNDIVKRDIKQPLPLFAIELEANNTNKDIYIYNTEKQTGTGLDH